MATTPKFDVIEASISDLLAALDAGTITSVELTKLYLGRIAAYDLAGPRLNSFTALNKNALAEAAASDARRAAGQPPRPLEGIPYSLKDSYKYLGMTVAAGSPALANLMPNEDAWIAKVLKDAGAVMIGKTNMPPMACGGMQRGLYGRAESPYNLEYLTAGFSSGSSNGSATSTAASFAAFGLGSETVSSGRSPASNNGLVAYTPSKGVLSCRGLWPLYPTCDVPVPHTRTVEDMLLLLDVIAQEDPSVDGDFWREQKFVQIPKLAPLPKFIDVRRQDSLQDKRLAVPRMYIGGDDPKAKPVTTSSAVIELWKRAKADLEALGATVTETDFPLVTNYEDDSVSGIANNVVGVPDNWNNLERADIVALAWDHFLRSNADPNYPNWGVIDPEKVFPKPQDYIPDRFAEAKNFLSYHYLASFAAENGEKMTVYDIPGMSTALQALETQRKRDLEDWMDENSIDAVVFPAAGDVGRADLEENEESARHALENGVKYSNGNRAVRHLGVPTVSVCMGIMEDKGMPMGLTFAGKAGQDADLLGFAYAFERATERRASPELTLAL